MRRPIRALAVAIALSAAPIAIAAGGVTELNEAGKAAYARGDLATAERLFREALEAAPEESTLHYHLAVVLTKQSRWKEAKDAYERCLRLGPSVALRAAAIEGLRSVTPLAERRYRPPDPEPAPVARRRVQRPADPPDTVRLRRWGGNWVVEATINDFQRANFVVDTGASICSISPRVAASLGLMTHDAPRIPLMTPGGPTSGLLVKIPSIRLGEMEVRDVPAVVHASVDFADGLLGNTFLRHFTITLDPDRGLLTLQPR
ncbi:MAG TPA: TIGR02281 family clan AA aspartic protease [Methylomirabilota bacterium]|jgi:aspartyl protease family protein